MGPGTIGWMSSGAVFLRDLNPYLREFRRKLQKTPKGSVDKRDRELNSAPPIYQFWAQNRSAIGGVITYWNSFEYPCTVIIMLYRSFWIRNTIQWTGIIYINLEPFNEHLREWEYLQTNKSTNWIHEHLSTLFKSLKNTEILQLATNGSKQVFQKGNVWNLFFSTKKTLAQ